MEYPRRTLLGGIATTATIALTGASASATDESSTDTDTDGATDADTVALESVLAYLPASAGGESLVVNAVDYTRRREADEPHEQRPHVPAIDVDPDSIATEVSVASFDDDDYRQPIRILAGAFEIEDDSETAETDDGHEYDRYEVDTGDGFVASLDDLLFVVDDEAVLDDALSAVDGDTDSLLETDDELADAIDRVGDADSYTVQFTDESLLADPDDDGGDIVYVAYGETVIDSDTIELSYVIAFDDEDEITDEVIELIEADFAYMSTESEPTADVDGRFVSLTVERDLEAEREIRDHESPGSFRVDEVDPDDDLLEIELRRGDPTPVEDLTLEVNDEEYDADIWADGHGTIEEGDTIVIEMDAVEPNTSIRMQHDHEMGSSGSATTIFNSFHFEFEYDYEAETIDVTYLDEFPLEGEDIHLVVYDESPHGHITDDGERVEPEPQYKHQPWDGVLEAGAETTLDEIKPGDQLLVTWGGTSSQDSLNQYQINPPGVVDFEYEYADEQLVATLETDVEQPAEAYELLIEDEPADTQWADEYETLTDGDDATIALSVESNHRVSVVWGDDDLHVGATQTSPSIELEYDDGSVEHAGGDELSAADLELDIWSDDGSEQLSLADEVDGTFEAGDTVDLGVDDARDVTLRYDEQSHVGSVFVEQ
ncbi:hypothetical protein G6M89_02675 [Natronolimnobius sp. AArcel1]|uniref:hypothetical protein n=1 Tax=Natronolimnobius sp. AArcel1 TaxID=1679093 RepID=UPI0013ECCA8E|nr:hypothetical protein [Natronolimnobius sp. AArcel1]NGM67926.1 hypothetical protein [Natronolimnobius sp. AArcel1]